jgi:predicted CoA-binding protein
MAFQNPSQEEIKDLLRRVKTIAVVGLSPKPDRPSYVVARAMQRYGYRIIPVRPATAEVLGETCYPTLAKVPGKIDLVDVFRAAEHIPAVVDECIALGVPAIWVQEGIVHDGAAEKARAAGMTVVMDRCIYKDYVGLMTS